jgi:hypothetical protein
MDGSTKGVEGYCGFGMSFWVSWLEDDQSIWTEMVLGSTEMCPPGIVLFYKVLRCWTLYTQHRPEFIGAHNAYHCSTDNAGFGSLLAIVGAFWTVLWTPMASSTLRLRQKRVVAEVDLIYKSYAMSLLHSS